MKTEIIINDKNLSRYNKRLQKIISNELGVNIKLSEANDLFAKILGCSSAFELNNILTADIIQDFKEKIKSPKLSGIDKITIVLKQVQKMLLNTQAEFWYAVFTENGGDSSPFIGKPEFNGIEIFSDFIGFTPFNYNPVPEEDYWLSINHELEGLCIQWGQIDEDIKSIKSRTPYEEKDLKDEDKYFREMVKVYFIKKEIYSSKKEIKILKEMAAFAQELMWETVNETKNWKDFWLVERNKITIQWGKELIVIE